MIALDTNLLVYAHREGTAEHDAAKDAILQAAQSRVGWGIATSCIAEFWAVVTHPSCPGGPSKPEQAQFFLTHLIEDGGGQIWTSGPGFAHRLLQKATELKIFGARIFDLHIALTAYENGARQIWTNDKHFVVLPGLGVVTPLSSGNMEGERGQM